MRLDYFLVGEGLGDVHHDGTIWWAVVCCDRAVAAFFLEFFAKKAPGRRKQRSTCRGVQETSSSIYVIFSTKRREIQQSVAYILPSFRLGGPCSYIGQVFLHVQRGSVIVKEYVLGS